MTVGFRAWYSRAPQTWSASRGRDLAMDRTEHLISRWREEGIEMVYPLLFRFRTSVLGEGWVAGVELHGGAVVTKEASGEYIAHGLKPGGVAGVGSTLIEAYQSYKEDVQVILYDMAGSEPFDAFRDKVLRFFDSADAGERRSSRKVGRWLWPAGSKAHSPWSRIRNTAPASSSWSFARRTIPSCPRERIYRSNLPPEEIGASGPAQQGVQDAGRVCPDDS